MHYVFSSIECSGMNSARKEVTAFASVIDPTLCDGVIVKLMTTQGTEQVHQPPLLSLSI